MGACAADRHQAGRAAGSHLRPGVDSDHRRGGSKCGHIHAIANGTYAVTTRPRCFLAGGNGRGDVAKAFSEGEAVAQMRPFRLQCTSHAYYFSVLYCAVIIRALRTMHVWVTHTRFIHLRSAYICESSLLRKPQYPTKGHAPHTSTYFFSRPAPPAVHLRSPVQVHTIFSRKLGAPHLHYSSGYHPCSALGGAEDGR